MLICIKHSPSTIRTGLSLWTRNSGPPKQPRSDTRRKPCGPTEETIVGLLPRDSCQWLPSSRTLPSYTVSATGLSTSGTLEPSANVHYLQDLPNRRIRSTPHSHSRLNRPTMQLRISARCPTARRTSQTNTWRPKTMATSTSELCLASRMPAPTEPRWC